MCAQLESLVSLFQSELVSDQIAQINLALSDASSSIHEVLGAEAEGTNQLNFTVVDDVGVDGDGAAADQGRLGFGDQGLDDDLHIAELISLYMMKDGYETEEVYDGREAIKKAESFQPDLILLDLMLPGMDGYQVCTQIRKTSRVPIIMLTAKGETFDKVLGLELGADDYIVKPFNPTELKIRVRKVLPD